MEEKLTAEPAAATSVGAHAVSVRNGYAYWLKKRPYTRRTVLVRTLVAGGDSRDTVTPDETHL